MPWYRHDRSRAVGDQHIVRDPDRNLLIVHRIQRVGTREYTRLGVGIGDSDTLAPARRLLDVGLNLVALDVGGDLVHQQMFGREDHIGRAEKRVRASGEDLDRLASVTDQRKEHPRTLRAADPIPLHLLDVLGPIDLLQVFEQAL